MVVSEIYINKLRIVDLIDILSNVKKFQNVDFETKSLIMSFKAIFLDKPTWENKYINAFKKYANVVGHFQKGSVTYDISFSEEMPKKLKEELTYNGMKAIEKINKKRKDNNCEQIF